MSDFISGIKNINPRFPLKPVHPSREDRKSGKRQKDSPPPESETDDENDDDDNSTIDEYI